MKRLFTTGYSDNGVSFAMLLMRVGLGLIMMVSHGFPKLEKFSSMSQTFSDPFGLGSTASLSLVIFAEFFCSFMLIIGLLTRLAAIPLIITMCVIVFMKTNGAVFGKGELPTLYLIGYLAILFIGPGKVSIDRLIGK